MKPRICMMFAIAALHALPASALTVTPGDVIRGAYTFPTFGATTLEPSSFLLRLSSLDLFGNGDAVGIRYLDAALTPLSFSRFDSAGTGLDPTIGIVFDTADFLPAAAISEVPRTGFVEIEGLAGSFDVLSLRLVATEGASGVGTLRNTTVDQFERVATPIPLPASGVLLLVTLAGMLGLGRAHRGTPALIDRMAMMLRSRRWSATT